MRPLLMNISQGIWAATKSHWKRKLSADTLNHNHSKTKESERLGSADVSGTDLGSLWTSG